jgi:hypothetical protein
VIEITRARPVQPVSDPPALAGQNRKRPADGDLRLGADPAAILQLQLMATRQCEQPGRRHQGGSERALICACGQQRQQQAEHGAGGAGCAASEPGELLSTLVTHLGT